MSVTGIRVSSTHFPDGSTLPSPFALPVVSSSGEALLLMSIQERYSIFIRLFFSPQCTYISLFSSFHQFALLLKSLPFSLSLNISCSVSSAMSTTLSLFNADLTTAPIFSPILKSADHVFPKPSFHSGTQAAAENIVASPDEHMNEKAAEEGT